MPIESLVVAARIGLSAVLLVSGAAKLADLTGSRRALRDFGVPIPLVGGGAIALPIVEIVAAVGLLPSVSAWYAAIAALGLLVVFAAGTAYQLARGRSPECHCFGQLSSARAGPGSLARNALLASLAGAIVVAGPTAAPGPSEWFADEAVREPAAALIALIAASVALVVGGFAVWSARRRRPQAHVVHAEARPVDESADDGMQGRGGTLEPSVPQRAAPFVLPQLDGPDVTLDALLGRLRPVLLAFLDPRCEVCEEVIPDVARWQQERQLTVVVISRGNVDENRRKFTDAGLREVLLERRHEVADEYGVTGTPTAIFVRTDGTIHAIPAFGPDAIRELVGHTIVPGDTSPVGAR
jgi:thiol-disulfide isomerase/thioredoxin